MKKGMSGIGSVMLAVVVALSLLTVSVSAFTIDPKFSLSDGTKCKSLANALDNAAEDDVITQDSNVPVYETDSGVTVTKHITLKTGRDFNGNINSIHYTGTDVPLFTVEKGGVLTLRDADLSGCENAVLTEGGLILVKNGGTLILDGTEEEPVTISGCRLTAPNAKGGAIYVQEGGKVIILGVTFLNNAAAEGADIFAENPADVTEGMESESETAAPEVTESETEVQTAENATESETEVPTAENATESEATGRAAEPTTGKPDVKSGCGSVIGGASALIITVAAVTVSVRTNTAGKKGVKEA